MSFSLLGYAGRVKKPILLALALALSGSALAVDTDIQKWTEEITYKKNPVLNDSTPMCKAVKLTYFNATEIQCFTLNIPAFLVKLDIESSVNLYTVTSPSFTIVTRWKPDSKTFNDESSGFYSLRFRSTTGFSSLTTILDSVSKYSTEVVLVYYK